MIQPGQQMMQRPGMMQMGGQGVIQQQMVQGPNGMVRMVAQPGHGMSPMQGQSPLQSPAAQSPLSGQSPIPGHISPSPLGHNAGFHGPGVPSPHQYQNPGASPRHPQGNDDNPFSPGSISRPPHTMSPHGTGSPSQRMSPHMSPAEQMISPSPHMSPSQTAPRQGSPQPGGAMIMGMRPPLSQEQIMQQNALFIRPVGNSDGEDALPAAGGSGPEA